MRIVLKHWLLLRSNLWISSQQWLLREWVGLLEERNRGFYQGRSWIPVGKLGLGLTSSTAGIHPGDRVRSGVHWMSNFFRPVCASWASDVSKSSASRWESSWLKAHVQFWEGNTRQGVLAGQNQPEHRVPERVLCSPPCTACPRLTGLSWTPHGILVFQRLFYESKDNLWCWWHKQWWRIKTISSLLSLALLAGQE